MRKHLLYITIFLFGATAAYGQGVFPQKQLGWDGKAVTKKPAAKEGPAHQTKQVKQLPTKQPLKPVVAAQPHPQPTQIAVLGATRPRRTIEASPEPPAVSPTASSFKSSVKLWPTQNTLITSGFNPVRGNGKRFHPQVDIDLAMGDPVKAIAPGEVAVTRFGKKGFGRYVLLDHGWYEDGHFESRYSHLQKILVQEGEFVKQGQLVGTGGNSGHVKRKKKSDGTHLDLGINKILDNGKHVPINPLKLKWEKPSYTKARSSRQKV